MKKIRSLLSKPLVLLFISALLSALPLTFSDLFLLSWVSFVPFFLALLKRSGKGNWLAAVGRGIFFGFFFHFGVYFWFLWLYPLDFTGLSSAASLAVVLLAWVGISLLHGVLYAVPTLLCHLAAKKEASPLFLLFLAITGILLSQRITRWSALAFPWVRISLGQYRQPALIQLASVFGVDGVDFLMLLVSALLALFFAADLKKKNRMLSLSFALLLFCANALFGILRVQKKAEGESIVAMAVQGCILSGEKWDGSTSSLDVYLSLTEENATERVDLVVWPESAVPINLAHAPSYQQRYRALSKEVGADLLMGCFWELDGATSNSAVLITEDQVSEPYSKRHLVPFGEVMPYRALLSRLFPFLEEINMLSSDLAQGTDSVIMETEKGNYGAVICFESIFPELCRQSIKDGAQMLVIVTNDSWYEDSPAVWQHLAHAVFRSVENGRAVVRSANSGVSALIDHRGRILEELGPLKRGTLAGEVSFSSETTLYTLLGDVFLPVLWGCVFLWWCILRRKQGRGKNAE